METRITSDNPISHYNGYLRTHIHRVNKVYQDILLPLLEEEGYDSSILETISQNIKNHDGSKYTSSEFYPYCNYFYDKDKYPRSSEEFSYAWNHHQKHNPHHWQYWCLINDVDEPQVQPLDIPLVYIIEMLCDWHAAGMHYGNTAYQWYQQQKDKMILSPLTRELVERYIVYLK